MFWVITVVGSSQIRKKKVKFAFFSLVKKRLALQSDAAHTTNKTRENLAIENRI